MDMFNRLKYILSPQFDTYETIAPVITGNVADIGFGTGFGTHLLTRNADNVIAYEVDECAINFARKAFPIPKLQFRYGDIEKGIDDGPFDYIILIDVIEHTRDDRKVLANIAKMADGGTLILSTPNRMSRYRKAETHIREYSPHDLATLLTEFFNDVRVTTYGFAPVVHGYENPLVAVCRNMPDNKEKKNGVQ